MSIELPLLPGTSLSANIRVLMTENRMGQHSVNARQRDIPAPGSASRDYPPQVLRTKACLGAEASANASPIYPIQVFRISGAIFLGYSLPQTTYDSNARQRRLDGRWHFNRPRMLVDMGRIVNARQKRRFHCPNVFFLLPMCLGLNIRINRRTARSRPEIPMSMADSRCIFCLRFRVVCTLSR